MSYECVFKETQDQPAQAAQKAKNKAISSCSSVRLTRRPSCRHCICVNDMNLCQVMHRVLLHSATDRRQKTDQCLPLLGGRSSWHTLRTDPFQCLKVSAAVSMKSVRARCYICTRSNVQKFAVEGVVKFDVRKRDARTSLKDVCEKPARGCRNNLELSS